MIGGNLQDKFAEMYGNVQIKSNNSDWLRKKVRASVSQTDPEHEGKRHIGILLL